MEHTKSRYEVLRTELPTDNPVELMALIAESEVLGDRVASEIRTAELSLSSLNNHLSTASAEAAEKYRTEKVAVMELKIASDVSDIQQAIDELTAEIRYLKRVNSAIEARCSVGQSFLSNMTAMVRAGINL